MASRLGQDDFSVHSIKSDNYHEAVGYGILMLT